jgi:hypothetical protein
MLNVNDTGFKSIHVTRSGRFSDVTLLFLSDSRRLEESRKGCMGRSITDKGTWRCMLLGGKIINRPAGLKMAVEVSM